MVNIKSKSQARRAVREAQTRANQARVQRERQNVEDTAVLLLAQGRLGGIADWEAERIEQIRAEGQRRRCEHQKKAAEAIARLQQRGESLQAIAELAQTSIAELRALLKSAAQQAPSAAVVPVVSPGALGGGGAPSSDVGAGA
ncbi:hypothetical protein [Mycobacterium simiae]|uniref:hypothetical protein n=1 Tax=Mycobacterium simiae TaxID=1784 RepID=UPI00262F6528|nr:hypothetical protein [Mycobacterium simiae]